MNHLRNIKATLLAISIGIGVGVQGSADRIDTAETRIDDFTVTAPARALVIRVLAKGPADSGAQLHADCLHRDASGQSWDGATRVTGS